MSHCTRSRQGGGRGSHATPRASHPIRWLLAVLLVLVIGGVVAVVLALPQDANPPPTSQPPSIATRSHWKRVLDDLAPLPPFLQSAPSPIQEAYAFAAARPDVLMWLPCYCGCVFHGDNSNLDCFINAFQGNGKPIWDPHAST